MSLDPKTKMFMEFFAGQGVTFVDMDTGEEIFGPKDLEKEEKDAD